MKIKNLYDRGYFKVKKNRLWWDGDDCNWIEIGTKGKTIIEKLESYKKFLRIIINNRDFCYDVYLDFKKINTPEFVDFVMRRSLHEESDKK